MVLLLHMAVTTNSPPMHLLIIIKNANERDEAQSACAILGEIKHVLSDVFLTRYMLVPTYTRVVRCAGSPTGGPYSAVNDNSTDDYFYRLADLWKLNVSVLRTSRAICLPVCLCYFPNVD
jgi:hypothetical protein